MVGLIIVRDFFGECGNHNDGSFYSGNFNASSDTAVADVDVSPVTGHDGKLHEAPSISQSTAKSQVIFYDS